VTILKAENNIYNLLCLRDSNINYLQNAHPSSHIQIINICKQ